jgi:predicted ATPase
VLVAVDDVQWVDRLSSFALRIMPGRLAGSAVVWLFAARTHSAAPIEDVIPPSSSDVTIEQIRLGPLPPAAIDELALQRRGVLPSGRLRQLLGMASGYPFLAVALLDGYPTEDLTNSAAAAMPARLDETPFEVENGLPQKLIDSVLRRLRMLPPDALRLVQVASVLGRSSGVEDAAALLGASSLSSLLPSLEAAVHAGILSDEGDRIEFRHDLFRQAVYEDMPPFDSQRAAQGCGATFPR